MKKNISINISGIIFHIEEDGYLKLKEYLESINKYFSSFEGSTEIIADIESRIAEICRQQCAASQRARFLVDAVIHADVHQARCESFAKLFLM